MFFHLPLIFLSPAIDLPLLGSAASFKLQEEIP
jgi:hypothetical protein